MIGFENFSVSAWIDNVLTRHVNVQRKSSPTPKKPLKNGAVAALFILGTSTLQSVAVADSAIMKVPPSIESSNYHPKLGDLVPEGYWPKLINEMKSWEKLTEPDIEYPDED
jgi:hypothetical protein